jgi:hypothetical protein
MWGSADVTYFAGGRTTLNEALQSDLQQNWRAGATLAVPVDVRNSIKLYASKGFARTGNSFDLLGVAWQYRWGGGIWNHVATQRRLLADSATGSSKRGCPSRSSRRRALPGSRR